MDRNGGVSGVLPPPPPNPSVPIIMVSKSNGEKKATGERTTAVPTAVLPVTPPPPPPPPQIKTETEVKCTTALNSRRCAASIISELVFLACELRYSNLDGVSLVRRAVWSAP